MGGVWAKGCQGSLTKWASGAAALRTGEERDSRLGETVNCQRARFAGRLSGLWQRACSPMTSLNHSASKDCVSGRTGRRNGCRRAEQSQGRGARKSRPPLPGGCRSWSSW